MTDDEKLQATIRAARARAQAAIAYANSMPDSWLPGELELHRHRMETDSDYANAPLYVRPPQFQ